jgi:hypothetical protein
MESATGVGVVGGDSNVNRVRSAAIAGDAASNSAPAKVTANLK